MLLLLQPWRTFFLFTQQRMTNTIRLFVWMKSLYNYLLMPERVCIPKMAASNMKTMNTYAMELLVSFYSPNR